MYFFKVNSDMMIFIANSESWNQKQNVWRFFFLSRVIGKNKEAEESIPSMDQQLKRTVRTSIGNSFLIP